MFKRTQKKADKIMPCKRMLDSKSVEFHKSIAAAKDYVAALDTNSRDYLYSKPFGDKYYSLMFNILSLLSKIDLRRGSRILEVGAGPGWVTEILACLGYHVDAIEPSEDFIRIAEKRVESLLSHHKITSRPTVKFHCTVIEAVDLPPRSFDAILFFDVLHHVVDEETAFEKCVNLLRDGGYIVIHEGAWTVGNVRLEETLKQEMIKFGTLENPFCPEYLDSLLMKHGCVDIKRHFQVNGLYPQEFGDLKIREIAQLFPGTSNIVIARTPSATATTADPDALTTAKIDIKGTAFDVSARVLTMSLALVNTGETVWLCDPSLIRGFVSIALYSGELGPHMVEAERALLPKNVAPGEGVTMDLAFRLPHHCQSKTWKVGLVNEQYFWFSARGTAEKVIELP